MPPFAFMPLRSNYPGTINYLTTKHENFQKCIESECWDEAYINAHLIFVHWLYRQLWAVSKNDAPIIRNIFSLHSFDSKYPLNKFLSATSGAELYNLKIEERKLARVFREICLNDTDKSRLQDLFDKRNAILHPSGTIVCNSVDDIQGLLEEQSELGLKISLSMAVRYTSLIEDSFRSISYSEFVDWNNNVEIEAYAVRDFELSSIDMDSMQLHLSGALV